MSFQSFNSFLFILCQIIMDNLLFANDAEHFQVEWSEPGALLRTKNVGRLERQEENNRASDNSR